MLIRSQDGKKLGDYCEVFIEKEYSNSNIFNIVGIPNGIDSEASFLGKYETEERAKEVLDEIAIKLKDILFAEVSPVYKMPEE